MFVYPYIVTPDDNDTWLVTFPDIPEAVTFASRDSEILTRAEDALWTALDVYVRDRRPLPIPSSGKMVVVLPLLVRIKLALHQSMVEQGVRKTELARRLRVHPPQVDRLLDFEHQSRLDQILAAFAAVGREVDLTVRPLPRPTLLRPRGARPRTEVKSRRTARAARSAR